MIALLLATLAASPNVASPSINLSGGTPSTASGVVLDFPTCGGYPAGFQATKGGAVTVARNSQASYDCGGTRSTANANVLRVDDVGALIEPEAINYFLNSTSPATQTVTLSTWAYNWYTAWVEGSGSMTLTAGTATTSGLPCTATEGVGVCTFAVTGNGTVVATVTGTLTFAQIAKGRTRTSPIITAGTTVQRLADAVSVATPPAVLKNKVCFGVTAYPPLGYGFSDSLSWGFFGSGTLYAANTVYFRTDTSGKLQVRFSDASAYKQLEYSFTWPDSAAGHRLVTCNLGGSVSLYVDGVSVGNASGSGTALLSAHPALVYLGQESAGLGSLTSARLRDFRISSTYAGAAGTIPWASRYVATVGDSIINGDQCVGTLTRASVPSRLNLRLGPTYKTTQDGVSGQTASQILSRWTSTIRARGHQYVVLEGGVNDLKNGTSATAIWTSLKQIVDEALADGAHVYMVTVLPWKNWAAYWTADKQTQTEALNTSIRTYAPGARYHVIDAYADMESSAALAASYDCGDGIHPNAAGADRLAYLIRSAMP